MRNALAVVCATGLVALSVAGCALTIQPGRTSDLQTIEALHQELARLDARRLEEARELVKAKRKLERRLRTEIQRQQVQVEARAEGLVITVVAEVLFDSGKAAIRKTGVPLLRKVAAFVREELPDREVVVEGHTDNEPIRHSGWASNWELSTARATSVLHFLIDEARVDPRRLSAVGYGEYHPVASNDSPEDRQHNRRVEVIIRSERMAERVRTRL